jgi:DNA-binding MarR family transcriptional regulator
MLQRRSLQRQTLLQGKSKRSLTLPGAQYTAGRRARPIAQRSANGLTANRSNANLLRLALPPASGAHPVSDSIPPRDLSETDLPGVDPASQGAVRALMRAMKLQRQLMTKLLADACGQDVHPAQAMCLQVLVAHDGITQRDLADRLQLSRPTITNMLQRMEQGGLVERRVDADDQRLTRVHVTATGRELAGVLRVVFARHIRETFGPMPAAERQELERLLRILGDNASRALRPADASTPTEQTWDGRPSR